MPRKPPESLPPVYSIRGLRVVLDADLAQLYGVETGALNRAVLRNRARFPKDFAFAITSEELANLKCQFGISSLDHGGRRTLPFVFTEHGLVMAAMLLRSERATVMSLFIVRAFVRMREELATSATILKRLAEIDHKLLKHDAVLRDIYQKLLPLLQPPPEAPKRRIGFR